MESGATQLGRGETISDTARVLSRFVDAIMIRTDDHQKIVDLARYATVPVINGLTDDSHPCQNMADLLTVMERRGGLAGIRWAWLRSEERRVGNECSVRVDLGGRRIIRKKIQRTK